MHRPMSLTCVDLCFSHDGSMFLIHVGERMLQTHRPMLLTCVGLCFCIETHVDLSSQPCGLHVPTYRLTRVCESWKSMPCPASPTLPCPVPHPTTPCSAPLPIPGRGALVATATLAHSQQDSPTCQLKKSVCNCRRVCTGGRGSVGRRGSAGWKPQLCDTGWKLHQPTMPLAACALW